jgi:hypothetical protein
MKLFDLENGLGSFATSIDFDCKIPPPPPTLSHTQISMGFGINRPIVGDNLVMT